MNGPQMEFMYTVLPSLSDVRDLDRLEVLGESLAADAEGECPYGGEAASQAGGVHVTAHAAVATTVDLRSGGHPEIVNYTQYGLCGTS